MEELRFAAEPRIDVRFLGCRDIDSVQVLERRNLPTPVVAGTTYHDVHVSVALFGHVGAACLLRSLGVGIDSVLVSGGRVTSPLTCPGNTEGDSALPGPARRNPPPRTR
jgi:hypothetical protein